MDPRGGFATRRAVLGDQDQQEASPCSEPELREQLRRSTSRSESRAASVGGAGRVARGFANGARLLVRVVGLVVSVVVLIIIAGILLVVLKANPSNSIVTDVHGWARSLAGPFDGIFSFHSARVAIAINWGIAAVVYLFLGGLIARLLRRAHR
jgi:hypothetical protein